MTDIKNVLSKLSREAGKTCGAHYEIYQAKYSESVLKYIETLPETLKSTKYN